MRSIVVMGVSGCGKSRIGQDLAARLGIPFVDGDDYHPAGNIEKMCSGQPLNDDDRAGWLSVLAGLLAERGPVVLACSALRRRYRDRLRQGAPDLVFVHLDGSYELLAGRLGQRKGHFFTGEAMLRDQFATLEPPGGDEAVVRVDIDQPPGAVVDAAAAGLARLE
ncbi:gluconokinase [Halodurantibacterium flavum]|uniref:Gluconokinase n=1 Tax=Halodurantibacterium flavum TaxID=1382802 RepID=A0ABW4S142_9RHOB